MIKLDFDYDYGAGENRAIYKGFTIRAAHHSHPENPWKAWDCMPPMVTRYQRDFTVYSEEYGNPMKPFDSYSDGQINRHWKAIKEQFKARNPWGFESDMDSDVQEIRDYYDGSYTLAEARREYLNDCDLTDFDTIAELWRLIGIPALFGTATGHSQGDWVDCLLVYTPALARAHGHENANRAKLAKVAHLESNFRLYQAWAFGDVYGYVIEDSNGDELESCWGFYGDVDESGLTSEAASTLGCLIRERRKSRAARLKQLIRSRAPLAARQTVLKGLPVNG